MRHEWPNKIIGANAGHVSCQCGRAGPPASLSSVVSAQGPMSGLSVMTKIDEIVART